MHPPHGLHLVANSITNALKAVNFWCKLVMKPTGSLPKLSYNMLFCLKDFGFPTWLDHTCTLLTKCELDSTLFTTYEMKCLISKVKTKLHQQFTDEWQTEMLKLSTLRTYHLFKSTFKTEKYLYILTRIIDKHSLAFVNVPII